MNISRLFRRTPTPPTAITDEPAERGPLLSLIDTLINWLFGLTPQAGRIRLELLTIAVLLTWLLLAIFSHPFSEWRAAIIAVVNPGLAPEIQNPSLNLLLLLFRAFFSWGTLGHVLAFALPFWLALQFAGIFLDDIFELKDIEVARRFITRAAFTYPTVGMIQIENGDVRPSDKRSTIVNIGGPGQVRVSLENVAVFEKVDGTPDLIGPTANNRMFTHSLDGFESLRQVIDIRDLTVPINDLFARTKDGIPITVQNIRLMFSVHRDSQYTTLSRPYPFSQQAILSLVYDQSKGHWTNSIIGLVRSNLVRFIGERPLAEIFATVGEPEIQRQIETQRKIQEYANQRRKAEMRGESSAAAGSTPPTAAAAGPADIPSPETGAYEAANRIAANKVPRLQISRRFYEGFTRGFPAQASARGVRLEWIDIGTWQPAPSAGKLLLQHEDAFRITTENLVLGNQAVLDDLCHEEQASELLRLIRQPIYRFYQMVRDGEERPEIVANLVEEFLGVLRAARDDFEQDNTAMPASVQQALEHIARYRRDDFNRTDHHSI
jgi:hypothetical protein